MKTYREIAGDAGSDILGQVKEQQARLQARMAQIAHTVAIMSGKGGVGKSVVTTNLAAALATQGHHVGILDADINGPSIAKMLGVRGQALKISEKGIVPALGPLGIKVISMDLLLPKETPVAWDAPIENPFIWRGTIEASALREFLADTDWGKLDFLFIDMPPGPERLPNLCGLLPEMDGAVVVTIPSEVAQLTVKRSIALAQQLKTRLLGLVENMTGYVCQKCGTLGELFPGDGEEAAKALGVAFLGKIPFDPRIARCSDQGVPFVIEHKDTEAGEVFTQIAQKIREGESER